MAHVGHGDEGRAALGRGQGPDVALGLAFGAHHGAFPTCRVAGRRAPFALRAAHLLRLRQGLGGVVLVRALFGLEDEAPALVQVDVAGGGGAVAVVEDDASLEDVGVLVVFGLGGFGPLDAEDGAEFGEEKLVVGAFGRARGPPPGDECVDGLGVGNVGGGIGHAQVPL